MDKRQGSTILNSHLLLGKVLSCLPASTGVSGEALLDDPVDEKMNLIPSLPIYAQQVPSAGMQSHREQELDLVSRTCS